MRHDQRGPDHARHQGPAPLYATCQPAATAMSASTTWSGMSDHRSGLEAEHVLGQRRNQMARSRRS